VLARHGHTVTILERNATSSMAGLGAGLSCSEDMVNFMSEYDLTGLPYTIDTKDMRVINTRGVVVGSGPPGYKQRSTNV
jgi:2-polyprenyl-6-methoxyphenol hydroxylase-like FAD-dependent oxidoreductase